MDGVRFTFIFTLYSLLLILKFTTVVGDPCSGHTTINDAYRSTKYKLISGEKAICDDTLASGWYRFTSVAGELTMPTAKPEPNYCGTVAPIWMRGTHPTTIGQVVQATACTNLNGRSDGCIFDRPIEVKKCANYFVYKLQASAGCAMAYCAGDKKPCPRGQTGLYPHCNGSSIVPFSYHLLPTPTVTYSDKEERKITMLCNFEQFPQWKNVSFHVEWFVDGYSVKNDTVCGNQTDDGPVCSVRESELQQKGFEPGRRINCRLRMRYTTSPKNKWTTLYRDSNSYFVGIKVSPTHVFLKECRPDKTVSVNFKPTVPIPIDQTLAKPDSVRVKIYVPEKYKYQSKMSALDTCELYLTTADMKYGKNLTIKGTCDNQQQKTAIFDYHFTIASTRPFWMIYRLPSVRVRVNDTSVGQCYGTGDPHYRTFDGTYYDFYEAGDYVLYKNDKRNFEVQTRLWHCWHVSCNCGVAIREGNDVIVISACNLKLRYFHPTLLRTQIRSKGPLARGTYIYRSRSTPLKHTVVLPSGAKVTAIHYGWGMNVYLRAPGDDAENTAGLCGDFNKNKNDDFNKGGDKEAHSNPTSFGKSWRVDKSKSYFEILPPRQDIPETKRSCECPTQGSNITKCKDNANLFKDFNLGKPITLANLGRKRRSIVEETPYTDEIMDYEEKGFFINDQEAHFALKQVRAKRQANGMSEEAAITYCKAFIEDSLSAKICKEKVPGIDIVSVLKQCVTDLKITGDKNFAASAFNTMKTECEELVLRNISLYTRDVNGELQPSMEIVGILCPGDCSNHGNCTNRTCICEEGYTSADCSMAVDAVPELLGIYDGGLCDIRRRPCKKTDLFGQDFIDSENLTCHAREFKVVESNWNPNPSSLKHSGTLIDIFGVRCNLPDPPTNLSDYDHEGTPVGGLWISISNDGEHKSQRQMRFISYDSVCMTCNETGNCTRKENSCLIRGHCFAANQSNPRNNLQKCKPAISQHFWTPREELTTTAIPKTTTESLDNVVIIIIEIRILMPWEPYYEDTDSDEYHSLANYCIAQIYLSYRREHREEFIILVDIFLFRPGSVIAEFKIKHKSNLTDPLQPIRAAIKDGKMGNLSVDPSSLKIKPADKVDDDSSKTVLIIVLVVVGVLLILVAIVIAVVIKKRRSKSNEDRVPKTSETTPPEAYEMPGKEFKEHHVYAEPRATAVYENAGFGQQDSTPNL